MVIMVVSGTKIINFYGNYDYLWYHGYQFYGNYGYLWYQGYQFSMVIIVISDTKVIAFLW